MCVLYQKRIIIDEKTSYRENSCFEREKKMREFSLSLDNSLFGKEFENVSKPGVGLVRVHWEYFLILQQILFKKKKRKRKKEIYIIPQ